MAEIRWRLPCPFTQDGKRNDAYYDGMGRFIASSCYFDENSTPSEVQNL